MEQVEEVKESTTEAVREPVHRSKGQMRRFVRRFRFRKKPVESEGEKFDVKTRVFVKTYRKQKLVQMFGM